ncbi:MULTISPECIES: hypothetical protein [unclassified Microcoleus]|nr:MULTISPECIES: hypothetical protein [unclassified Microcoleus]
MIAPLLGLKGRGRYQTLNCQLSTVNCQLSTVEPTTFEQNNTSGG